MMQWDEELFRAPCEDISLLRTRCGGWAVTTHTFLVTCCCARRSNSPAAKKTLFKRS